MRRFALACVDDDTMADLAQGGIASSPSPGEINRAGSENGQIAKHNRHQGLIATTPAQWLGRW
jgi:hypothetical protein